MRWKCVCAYEGTNFCGWQSQPNGNGVQDHIEARLAAVFKHFVRIHGSSRTDAGVHARGQVFHFDADWLHGTEALKRSINSQLDLCIQVKNVVQVNEHFHARFSTKGKRYHYYFQKTPADPFEYRYVWPLLAKDFCLERIQEVLPLFLGTHNFKGFAGKILSGENPIKTVHSLKIVENGDKFHLEIIGSGYLYRMVRMIAGALVMCAYGKINAHTILDRLNLNNLQFPLLCAPAKGLFLEEVYY